MNEDTNRKNNGAELSDAALDEVSGGFLVNRAELAELIAAFRKFWNAVPDERKEEIVDYLYRRDLAGFAASMGVPIDDKLIDPDNWTLVLLAFTEVVNGNG